MAVARNLREVGDRIEGLLEDLRAGTEARTWQQAEELVHLLVDLYGAGLERIVEVLREEGQAGDQTLHRLSEDPFLASLLVLHNVHPIPVEERIQTALDKVRPYLGSHAGGIEFLGLDDEGVAHLKLEGSCDGCPSSTVTVQMAVERAIEEAAPEVVRLEVEGVAETSPGHGHGHGDGPALLQVQPLRSKASADGEEPPGGGWTHLEDLALLPGETRGMDIEGVEVVLVSASGNLYAYRDACPGCGAPLREGALEETILACLACARRFDVRLAGRQADGGDEHLEPLPLLPEAGGWKIAVPQGAGS